MNMLLHTMGMPPLLCRVHTNHPILYQVRDENKVSAVVERFDLEKWLRLFHRGQNKLVCMLKIWLVYHERLAQESSDAPCLGLQQTGDATSIRAWRGPNQQGSSCFQVIDPIQTPKANAPGIGNSKHEVRVIFYH